MYSHHRIRRNWNVSVSPLMLLTVALEDRVYVLWWTFITVTVGDLLELKLRALIYDNIQWFKDGFSKTS